MEAVKKQEGWKIIEGFKVMLDASELTWGGEKFYDLSPLLPENASHIKVFVRCESGFAERDIAGFLILRTENDIAYFAYHSYNQDAWAYNSENLILMLDDQKVLRITTTTKRPSGNFLLEMRVIAYK